MLHKNFFVALAATLITASAQGQSARVQVIHNCPDAAADSVDVYVNGALLLDNFAFRTASPFVNAAAGTVTLAVAPKTSTSAADAIFTATPTLTAGSTYVVVAEGIVSPTGYNPAPPFRLSVFGMGRETAPAGMTDVLVAHGSTDAPTVDVRSGGNVLVDDISFGQFSTGYLSLPTSDYTLSVTTSDGAATVASYRAPLQTLGLGGRALTVLASGFVGRAANSNGPAFGLYVALPAGGSLVPLPLVSTTSVTRPAAFAGAAIYPNPATNRLYLRGAEQATEVLIQDMSGKVVLRAQPAPSIDIMQLVPGTYTVSLVGNAGTYSMPFRRG